MSNSTRCGNTQYLVEWGTKQYDKIKGSSETKGIN
jgi:hypothetical protein